MSIRGLVCVSLWGAGGLLLPLGCGSKVRLGDDDIPSNSAGTGGAGTGGGADAAGADAISEGPPPELDMTSPDGTCPATCDDAAGTVTPITSVEQFYANLVGRWLICSGKGGSYPGPADVIGVEYEAPTLQDTPYQGPLWRGNMYYLVEGEAGPERGKGFDYQLTYDVSPQVASEGPPVQLNMHPTPSSGFGGAFLYSPCPRQWAMSGGSASPDSRAVLVPVDGGVAP